MKVIVHKKVSEPSQMFLVPVGAMMYEFTAAILVSVAFYIPSLTGKIPKIVPFLAFIIVLAIAHLIMMRLAVFEPNIDKIMMAARQNKKWTKSQLKDPNFIDYSP